MFKSLKIVTSSNINKNKVTTITNDAYTFYFFKAQ